jgi:hypothetical protein
MAVSPSLPHTRSSSALLTEIHRQFYERKKKHEIQWVLIIKHKSVSSYIALQNKQDLFDIFQNNVSF